MTSKRFLVGTFSIITPMLLIAVLLVFPLPVLQAKEPVSATGSSFYILRDAPAGTSIEDVCCGNLRGSFVPLETKVFSTAWGGAPPLWLKIEPRGKTGVLKLSSGVSEVIIYKRDPVSGKTITSRSGNTYPTADREIIAPYLAFSITLDDLAKDIFLQIDQKARISVSIALVEKSDFFSSIQRQNSVRTGLYGAILIMIVYNLFLSFIVRDRRFLLNSIIISLYLWYDAIITGVGDAYIWRNIFTDSSNFGIYAILNLLIFGNLFLFHFLKIHDEPAGIEKFFLVIAALSGALFVLNFILPISIMQIMIIILSWITIPGTVFIAVYLATKGRVTAKIILVPLCGSVVPGLFLVLLEVVFGVRFGEIDSHILEITLVLEAILFSLALASRIRLTEQATLEANSKLIKVSEAGVAKTIAALDAERQRLGKELHDGVGQDFLVVVGSLKQLARENKPASWKSAVPGMITSATNALEELRRISRDMYPASIEHLGLVNAVELLLENMEASHQIETELVIDFDEATLAPQVSLHVYRIIQECLSNIARHSEALHCRVSIVEHANQIKLTIEDDGIGHDTSDNHEQGSSGLGFTSIGERVVALKGHWKILKSPLGGLRIYICFPSAGRTTIGKNK